ncbi:MAG: hypothetical protein RDU14_17355 [Melioribacteraceae bacterium]|nr:hypothetical protein [Melioribacteraceae bacterium]
MKYEEMKERTRKIESLKTELERLEKIKRMTGFSTVRISVPGNRDEVSIQYSTFNDLIPLSMIQAFATKKAIEIEEEIKELEK